MKLLIRAQERAELDRIKELIRQVEEEITELKVSDAKGGTALEHAKRNPLLQLTWLTCS